jgi:hypothetical protein
MMRELVPAEQKGDQAWLPPHHVLPELKMGDLPTLQQGIISDYFAHCRLECGAPVGQPDPFLAKQATDRVLEGSDCKVARAVNSRPGAAFVAI